MNAIEQALLKEVMDKFERMTVALEDMAKTNAEMLELQKQGVENE